MKCPRCNNEVNPNAKFCDNCGMALQQQATTPTAKPITPPTAQIPNKPSVNSSQPAKKEPWYMRPKIVFGGLIGIIVLVSIIGFAVSGNSNSSSTTKYNSSYSKNTDYDDSEPSISNLAQFKGKEFYNKHNIIISLQESKTDKLKFVVKNNNKVDVAISYNSFSVNGIMDKSLDEEIIPSKKKLNLAIDLTDYSDFTIEYIDIMFSLYGDDFDYTATDIFRIKSDEFTKENKEYNEGTQIQKVKGLSVSYDEINDNEINLCIVNNNDYYVDLNVDSLSVNGWAYDTVNLDYATVYPHSLAVYTLNIERDFIEENSIDKIKNIEFKFDVMKNGDSYKSKITKAIKFDI